MNVLSITTTANESWMLLWTTKSALFVDLNYAFVNKRYSSRIVFSLEPALRRHQTMPINIIVNQRWWIATTQRMWHLLRFEDGILKREMDHILTRSSFNLHHNRTQHWGEITAHGMDFDQNPRVFEENTLLNGDPLHPTTKWLHTIITPWVENGMRMPLWHETSSRKSAAHVNGLSLATGWSWIIVAAVTVAKMSPKQSWRVFLSFVEKTGSKSFHQSTSEYCSVQSMWIDVQWRFQVDIWQNHCR